jgi:hypothetical protein
VAYKAFDDKRKKPNDDDSQPPIKKFALAAKGEVARTATYTAAVTKYLIASMRPMSEVENDGFVEIFSEIVPGYKLPCRKTITRKVVTQCESVRQKIIAEMASISYCAGQANHQLCS